ncbi:MAG: hypothetical protein P4L46_05310 [Fimbriimonas sp.]|nr:hypothetical protein [Fimbriimonas sp.]
MARKDASTVGIDLHEGEIRIVQVKTRANKTIISKIGRASMPHGAVIRGKVMQPGSVAIALRLLLNSMDIGANSRAVFGILGDTTLLRTLPVPPVPDNDLTTIVTGEVEHYGIVKTEGGTHSFLRLFPPPPRNTDPMALASASSANQENLRPVNVTIVALEEDVIANLRETAHEANIGIEALEPSQYAMYRSVLAASANATSAFGLMVNPSNTDIAIAYRGNLVAYRRIDTGSRSILMTVPSHIDYGYVEPSQDLFVDDLQEYDANEIELNSAAIESLSVEVQRTLDYYQREFPNIGIGDVLYLCIDDSRIVPLADELSQRLGVTIELVQPVGSPNDSPDVTTELVSGSGPLYSAAYGLALQGQLMAKVPRVDLFIKERSAVQKAESKRNFKGSIITSIIAIALGSVVYSLYGKQITQLQNDTREKESVASELRKKTDTTLAHRHNQSEQYKALRHEGVPLTAIMDFISMNLDRATSLNQLVVSTDLTVTIDGSSINEKVMLETQSRLQTCPVIHDLQMVTFYQQPEDAGYGVAFQFKGKTISLDRVEYAEDVKQ